MSARRRLGALAPPGRRPGARGTSHAEPAAALAAVAAAVRAGAPPAVAWSRAWGVRTRDGLPDPEDVRARCRGDDAAARAVLAAAALAHRCGAPLAVVLERIAVTIEDSADLATRRAAAFAGPRATTRLLTWLPAFGVLLGAGLGADPVGVLLDGGPGTAALLGAVVLSVAGHWWTRRLLAAARAAGSPA